MLEINSQNYIKKRIAVNYIENWTVEDFKYIQKMQKRLDFLKQNAGNPFSKKVILILSLSDLGKN